MSKNEIEAANRIPNSNFISDVFGEFLSCISTVGILCTIVDEGIRRTAFVIQEIHIISFPSLANQKLVRAVLETQKFFRWQAPPKRRFLHKKSPFISFNDSIYPVRNSCIYFSALNIHRNNK